MGNCGCKNKIVGYTDMSNVEPIPWKDAKYIIGMSECGNLLVVEKPDYDSIVNRIIELEAKQAELEAKLNGVNGFWAGTQDEYDAIENKDPEVYYHTYEQ